MKILRFFYKLWMKFAAVLGWINTRILLTIIYFLLISPMAVILRIFGKKFLLMGFDKNASSYWEERPQKAQNNESYFRQF